MNPFQQLLVDHAYCQKLFETFEEWARHVEDALNNTGLKVVDAYDEKGRE